MHERPLFWPTVLFLLLAALVTAVGIVGERNVRALANAFAWVTHSRIALDELAHLQADVLRFESSSRGYRMTGDREFLANYDAARDVARSRLGRVRELVAPHPGQERQVDSLAVDIERKIAFHEEMHLLVGGNPPAAAAMSQLAREGIVLMDRVDDRLDAIRAAEIALLEERRRSSERTYLIARMAGIVLAVAALLLGFLVYTLFARVVQAQSLEARAQEVRAGELAEAVSRATAELERRAQELERSNRDLEEFAFIASHDLQEPLRKVRTFADRIAVRRGSDLDPESADSLHRIQGAAGRMQQLVENLLEFSRVARHGRRFEAVDLAAVLADVGEDLSSLVERENGRLEVGWLPRIWGDRVQLRQLFHNLVTNGLRFHGEGVAPVVVVRGEVVPPAEPGTPATALISVIDNGIGFEPEYAERIFGLFQRLHGRDRYEGSGLGLAIARRIAEHHRGRVTAQAQPGKGAVFQVELPLPPATESTS